MPLQLNIRVSEAVACSLAVLFVFAAHLAYGANNLMAGLVLAAVEGAALLILLAWPWARRALQAYGPLVPPGVALLLVLLVALWTLTPFGPGGPNPAWTYVKAGASVTVDRSATLVEIIKLLGLAAMFGTGFVLGASDARARWLVNTILCVGGAFALFAVVRFVSGAQLGGSNRLTAMFGSANTAGSLFGVLMVLAVGMGFAAERRSGREDLLSRAAAGGPYWALVLLFAACLILTASRGAALGAVVAVAVFFGLEAWAGKLRPRAIAATLLCGAALMVAQGTLLLSRIGAAGVDAKTRGDLLAVHWKAFEESPLLGYGLGSFDTVNKLHLDAAHYHEWWDVRAAHNVYLQWLEEAGLIGALPMFACIALILWSSFRGVGRRRRSTTVIRGLIATNFVLLVHGWSDFALQVPSMTAFWSLLLGAQLALANTSTQRHG